MSVIGQETFSGCGHSCHKNAADHTISHKKKEILTYLMSCIISFLTIFSPIWTPDQPALTYHTTATNQEGGRLTHALSETCEASQTHLFKQLPVLHHRTA